MNGDASAPWRGKLRMQEGKEMPVEVDLDGRQERIGLERVVQRGKGMRALGKTGELDIRAYEKKGPHEMTPGDLKAGGDGDVRVAVGKAGSLSRSTEQAPSSLLITRRRRRREEERKAQRVTRL